MLPSFKLTLEPVPFLHQSCQALCWKLRCCQENAPPRPPVPGSVSDWLLVPASVTMFAQGHTFHELLQPGAGPGRDTEAGPFPPDLGLLRGAAWAQGVSTGVAETFQNWEATCDAPSPSSFLSCHLNGIRRTGPPALLPISSLSIPPFLNPSWSPRLRGCD